jgi:predicted small lipoprotein YifL
MKKVIAIISVLVIVLSLAACGKDAPAKNTDAPTTQQTEPSTTEPISKPDANEPEVTVPESTAPSVQEPPATEEPHTHSWGEWKVYKEATTDAEGESRRTCDNCKEYESKPIAKLPAAENVFINENNNYYDVDVVSIRPRYVYWENGKLIAECFVINGFNHNVFNINVKSLSFNNGSVDIASAVFGVMNDVVLAPYNHVVWRFEFSADCVANYGADLSSLDCVYKVENNY